MTDHSINKENLQYLGEEYQFKLTKEFLEDPNCFRGLYKIIDPNTFTVTELRQVVGCLKEYYEEYDSIPSYQTLSFALKKNAHTNSDIEIYDGVIERIKHTSSEGSMEIQKIAKDFFVQQHTIKFANKLLQSASQGRASMDADTLIQSFQQVIDACGSEEYEETRVLDGVEDVLSDDYRITIPTGVDKIDEMTHGGLALGELGAIVGGSGFGKTSLTTSMAFSAAVAKTPQNDYQGFKVIQIVFEDRLKQIKRKYYSKMTQVEAALLSQEEYKESVLDMIKHHPDGEMIQKNLVVMRYASGEVTIDKIKRDIQKKINSGFRPDLVLLDYFECLKLTGSNTSSKWEKETSTMRKIEAMVNKMNLAIWVAIQGNRNSINTDFVGMEDTGGAFQKMQIAHIIMTIARTEEDKVNNRAKVSIVKNRAGQSGDSFTSIFNNGICLIQEDTEASNDLDFGSRGVENGVNADLCKQIFGDTRR